jgi:hypothetical protein
LYKFKTNDQNKNKMLKFRIDIGVWQGLNRVKLKVRRQLGMQLKEIKSRRIKLNLVKFLIKP